MKLHVHPFSPSCRNVLATAKHLQMAVDIHVVDVVQDEHHRPEYLNLNPNGLFPVLEDSDFVLWESNAITQYLAAPKPGPWFPPEPRARADIARWQFWEQAHWTPACRPWMWENIFKAFKGQGNPDQKALEEAAPKFRQFAGLLDRHLQERKWLAGDAPSLADFSVASPLMYKDAARMPMESFRHLNRWYARMESLPAWRQTDVALPSPARA